MSAPPWPDPPRDDLPASRDRHTPGQPARAITHQTPNNNGDTPDEYAAQPASTKEPHHDGNDEPNDPTAVPHHRRIVDPLRRERGSGRPRRAAEPVAREPVRLRADVGATGRTRASRG